MPTFAPYRESPWQLTTPPEAMPTIPQGELVESPWQLNAPPDTFGAVLTARFPVPPAAFGFLHDGHEDEWFLDGLENPWVYLMAVGPEPSHLEPNVGQIWPR